MEKKYGIRVTMPEDDTLSASHLLGENWENFRWYETAEKRDRVYEQMSETPENYREGDHATIILEKVNP